MTCNVVYKFLTFRAVVPGEAVSECLIIKIDIKITLSRIKENYYPLCPAKFSLERSQIKPVFYIQPCVTVKTLLNLFPCYCRHLMTCANSLDSDQAKQTGSKLFDILMRVLKEGFEKFNFEKNQWPTNYHEHAKI